MDNEREIIEDTGYGHFSIGDGAVQMRDVFSESNIQLTPLIVLKEVGGGPYPDTLELELDTGPSNADWANITLNMPLSKFYELFDEVDSRVEEVKRINEENGFEPTSEREDHRSARFENEDQQVTNQ